MARISDGFYREEVHERGYTFIMWSKGKLKLDGFPEF
jgi:hypothetical protein